MIVRVTIFYLFFSCSILFGFGDKTTGQLFGDDSLNFENYEGESITRLKRSGNVSNGFLPLPPGYNKLAIPLGNISDSIFVFVQLAIREVLDVDTKNEIVELDTELQISWIDWEIWKYFLSDKEARKKAMEGPEEIILDSEFLRQIWKPDIYIEELASVERTQLLSRLITLRFLVKNEAIPGAITFRTRQTLKLRCAMDFKFYPADIQSCEYTIRSYSYPDDQMFLLWDELRSVCLNELEDANFDFQISDVEPGGELDTLNVRTQTRLTNMNFSALSFKLNVRRNVTYHMVQTYLPSVLLVLITWLCFLLPVDMVEARIGISMTTLLTLTAMFSAVREQAPEVSYAMAIDIWMVFCIFLIFVALVLFTVIYWMRRKFQSLQEKSKANKNGNTNAEEMAEDEENLKLYGKITIQSIRYGFALFVLVFIVFLVTYSFWVFIYSNYFDWEPSDKYNAVELEDGNQTNKLSVKQETKFEEDDEDKVTANDFRYLEIFESVIEPALKKYSRK